MSILIGSGIAASMIYASMKWTKTDKEKIQHVFRNIGYSVGDQVPRLANTHKTETHTTYTYHVPFGLIDNEKLNVIEPTLNKPTNISFTNGKLHVKVYNNKLQTNVHYNDFTSKGNWSIPVGMSHDGQIYHDFDRIPHMIVSGSTTWGKTVFMRSMMTHLIENIPDGVEFYVLDLKGGLAFNPYRNLRQVKGVAGDFASSHKVLKMVKKSILKDMEYLRSIEAENAKEGNVKTRKFILVDEAGELKPERWMGDDEKHDLQQCQSILSYIARVAGQIGYKLIFGTQYPVKEILNNQIKANALARVSFRLATSVQSGVAIDQPGAEKLEYPGRAIYRTVDTHILQTPFITKKEIKEKLKEHFYDSRTKKEIEGRTDTIEIG